MATAPADLSQWTTEIYDVGRYDRFPLPSWIIADDGLSVTQVNNARPSLFCSDFDTTGSAVEGAISVRTNADDDFIGFAFGYNTNDINNPQADYLLLDWKQGSQDFSFGCQTNAAPAGIAVSRVEGRPIPDEFWGHVDASCDDFGPAGLTELQRGMNLGSTGWSGFVDYNFRFEFQESKFLVFVDGVLEIDLEVGPADHGRFCFYNFSQVDVRYSGFVVEQLPTPSPQPVPTAVPTNVSLSTAPQPVPVDAPSIGPSLTNRPTVNLSSKGGKGTKSSQSKSSGGSSPKKSSGKGSQSTAPQPVQVDAPSIGPSLTNRPTVNVSSKGGKGTKSSQSKSSGGSSPKKSSGKGSQSKTSVTSMSGRKAGNGGQKGNAPHKRKGNIFLRAKSREDKRI